MLKREIEIDGRLIPFRASATVPRLYRAKFKHDIFRDLAKLEQSYKAIANKQEKQSEDTDAALENTEVFFNVADLELFENIAYIMAFHADHNIPPTVEDWLDEFDVFSIYEVLPQLLELWGENIATEIKSKKELAGVTGK